MGKRMGFNDEINSSSGKDVKETKQLDGNAREAHANESNDLKRYVSKQKPYGTLGSKGHSK